MDNYHEIIKSFGRQACKFSAYHMSKKEYTDYLIKRIEAKGTEHVLEVAAGTCICGRALSPYVSDIECLDLTEEMLAQGRKLAEEQGLKNISFVEGNAESLPYEDEVFDLVVTRLSLHHFVKPEVPFKEMQRVLKHSGKLVIWDMVATAEALREVDDSIECMRDPSHRRILSKEEFEQLYGNEFYLQTEEITFVPVNLNSWMDLTDTPSEIREKIISLMKTDFSGGAKTGFYPYEKDGEIFFDHRWLLLIGIKK